MKKSNITELQQGLNTAFIDKSFNSNLAYRPEFISNDYRQGKKVLTSIEQELANCEEFYISVAFIKESGIEPLLLTLKELEKKNIPGKILTTDYLTFSEPNAFDTLASLKNIQLKMFQTSKEIGGFHTKGYIFKREEIYHIIIGSSNMTISAITKNREWNTKIISAQDGQITQDVLEEFNALWEDEHSLDYSAFIEEYRQEYLKKQLIKKQQELAIQDSVVDLKSYILQPNKMQVAFVQNILKIQKRGGERALLLSSTGTGKTYASAFALREMQPRKALFVVHREQIAKQAIRSYKKVFGNNKSFGLLSGTHKEVDADYLFSTMQMMAKSEILTRFSKKEFDVIVLDECHHAGSDSYQRIMDYFQPKFWLGMTASPDTNNYDIYSIFHHQIAYEIRLQQALEEDLLCPFHYFGITDLEINGQVFDDSTGMKNFSNLISDERVKYIIEQTKYYGFSGDRVKGLVFCSRKEEAKELSSAFNRYGYRTEALTGDDSQEQRERIIDRLTDDDNTNNQIDYIFTVDIFNEGVDVPEINQVIMLRPTESPVVFIQQLGRGLRKCEGKEYVVILDFIGNYMNNFMIPIALSGDRSYNKDTIRKFVISGNNVMPGYSTIHFDEVTKNRIFRSIDQIKGVKEIIRTSFINLKKRLNRVPYLTDFYDASEVDPLLILSTYKTYQAFLETMENYYKDKLTEKEKITLEYLSRNIAGGKRPYELEILSNLIETESIDKLEVQKRVKEKYGITVDMPSIDKAVVVLEGKFVSKADELERYEQMEILKADIPGKIRRYTSFYNQLNNMEFSKQMEDILLLGLKKYQDNYSNAKMRRGEFILYEKYTRRDVCLLLNWEKDYSSTMYGMKRIGDDVCIFITYHKVKGQDEQEYMNGKPDYADEFIDNQTFMWDSQIGKGPDSSYIQEVITAKRKHLFIKKSDAEAAFYFMGYFDVVRVEKGEKKDNAGRIKAISKVEVRLQDAVREDILKYLKSAEQKEA